MKVREKRERGGELEKRLKERVRVRMKGVSENSN